MARSISGFSRFGNVEDEETRSKGFLFSLANEEKEPFGEGPCEKDERDDRGDDDVEDDAEDDEEL